ncbi:TPA: hypothetical protein MIR02_25970 [Klebsiella pneumoniae]|nr:hypothetical protein [Klebsiella pneumoniae]MDH8340660.1 hypothetical protein [Klebsiella pneumoniae]MDH8628853.1 hypothetical protein [Klebsiella pneumoniae]HBX2794855.1 hypothetical protein [Klebsiella pneumoniae]HBY1783952.1 hypothetical protein [Klebsiella pneumoniae]
MTITPQAVNELIASLESAGELSIREQKFLKLAKEFRICSASLDAAIKTGNVLADQNSQLAAENAALKDINAWCKTDAFKNMYREFKTAESLGCSDVDCMHDAMLVAIMHAPATPATDRIVAGIKADGVEEFAAKLRIPGDDQFFDALAKGVALAADDFAKHLREGEDK